MELQLSRIAKRDGYTIGKLYVNGEYFCDTLEDTDRGITDEMTTAEIKAIKVAGSTAIPTGCYTIDMNTVSPKFSKRAAYQFCEGRLPRLRNVKGFDGVLIHIGNTAADTEGCVLVGKNTAKGTVTSSTDTFKELWNELELANINADTITLDIS